MVVGQRLFRRCSARPHSSSPALKQRLTSLGLLTPSNATLHGLTPSPIPYGPSALDLCTASEAVRALEQVHQIRGELPLGAFIPNKLQKNYRLSDELLVTAKTLGLMVTPGLGLRQAFADAAGQRSVVWQMNRRAETAAQEMRCLFDHLFLN